MTNEIEDIEIGLLLEALFQRYHYDFRHYARASIKRRLLQARSHFGMPSLTALQELGLIEEQNGHWQPVAVTAKQDLASAPVLQRLAAMAKQG